MNTFDDQTTMARQARKQSGTGIYHVMLRGINRQDIFEDEDDYLRMTECLRALRERYDDNGIRLPALCVLYAYCIMSNHLHLLIQERTEGISEIIKRLGVSYAHYYNKKYDRNGHLFQDRFKSEPVNDMAYFVTLLRYIHQNPVKAGLTDNPLDYPWSSWQEYVPHKTSSLSLCNTDTVLKRIPFDDLKDLVYTELDEKEQILDVDNDGYFSVSDEDIRHAITANFGLNTPHEMQALQKDKRNDIIAYLCGYGGSLRQIARVTGVSFGIVQKVNKALNSS